jgi:nitroreductase
VETWDAISSRRDVRSYTDQPIAPTDRDRILEAAWRAPSSSNEQRWDFVVCTERRRLQDLAKVWRHGGHVATSAATIALVVPDAADTYTRESIQFDLGQAAMSVMLAAADRRRSLPVRPWFSQNTSNRRRESGAPRLRRRSPCFPDDRFCALLIPLGYPADRPLRPIHRPNRRPFDEVVHREHW